MLLTRRDLIHGAASTALAAAMPAPALSAQRARPFEATWESLVGGFRPPEWFRDAKFGIWAHWGPQGVGLAGDWYARKMYIQGDPYYDRHLKDWGHPADTGYIDMIGKWQAERWEPAKLLDLYQRAGAKYFMALACHHDNFDCFDSKHHEWNSVRVGPKRDVVGTWEKLVRQRGMRFGMSNHTSHAWHWFQTAYDYDVAGPRKGERYDAYRLTKADGRGKYWEGLDPQALYSGRNMVMPDGIEGIEAGKDWHLKNDRVWTEASPPNNPAFVANWVARAKDAIDRYKPDLFYYDNVKDLPFEQAGLDVTAYYYNQSLKWHGGVLDVAATAKKLPPERKNGLLDDIERGALNGIPERAWQTDTCLGEWFYNKDLPIERRYMTPRQVVHRLVDTVSKNGTLMLSVPLRPDGTIDEEEHSILMEVGDWIAINGEAIYATRPWRIYGEGPTASQEWSASERTVKPFTPADIRYTTKGDVLYAIALGVPEDGTVRLARLGDRRVSRVELLGERTPLEFRRDGDVLVVKLPPRPRSRHALALRLRG